MVTNGPDTPEVIGTCLKEDRDEQAVQDVKKRIQELFQDNMMKKVGDKRVFRDLAEIEEIVLEKVWLMFFENFQINQLLPTLVFIIKRALYKSN